MPKIDAIVVDRAYPGSLEIIKERVRQYTELGFTREHDQQHLPAEFVQAALWYLGAYRWPWDDEEALINKPRSNDYRRNLIKAGALIAAAIDRFDEVQEKSAAMARILDGELEGS